MFTRQVWSREAIKVGMERNNKFHFWMKDWIISDYFYDEWKLTLVFTLPPAPSVMEISINFLSVLLWWLPQVGDLVVVPEVEVLHEVLPVRVVPGRPVARPAPECVPALEVSLLLGLRHLAVPGGGDCNIMLYMYMYIYKYIYIYIFNGI